MCHAAEVHRGRAFVATASGREKVSRRGVFSPQLPLSLVEGLRACPPLAASTRAEKLKKREMGMKVKTKWNGKMGKEKTMAEKKNVASLF